MPQSSISATDLAAQIESHSAPLILDTRSRYEYDKGHVPGAVFFPFWKSFFADKQILQRCQQGPVIVYCQHGPRATLAGFALRQSGCQAVIELSGHMSGWERQNLPISRPDADSVASNNQNAE
ncbi:MAG: rhodanese-like domain-containing protein [Gammaproteobacteria bacterium]|nr:rhodanese-like domain-containing protein [Gammaproteobacteria bacterium]